VVSGRVWKELTPRWQFLCKMHGKATANKRGLEARKAKDEEGKSRAGASGRGCIQRPTRQGENKVQLGHLGTRKLDTPRMSIQKIVLRCCPDVSRSGLLRIVTWTGVNPGLNLQKEGLPSHVQQSQPKVAIALSDNCSL
jgi:hypothetical protein